jgi:hypothetical protein
MPGSLPASPCRWQGIAEGPAKSCNRSVHWSSAGSVRLCQQPWPTVYLVTQMLGLVLIFVKHSTQMSSCCIERNWKSDSTCLECLWVINIDVVSLCQRSCYTYRLFSLLCLASLQVEICTVGIIFKWKLEKLQNCSFAPRILWAFIDWILKKN